MRLTISNVSVHVEQPAVKTSIFKHVAFAQLVEGGAHCGRSSRAPLAFLEHPLGPGPCQRIALQIDILVSGADPRGADQNDSNSGGGIYLSIISIDTATARRSLRASAIRARRSIVHRPCR
jgi:hypothetical protein